MSDPVSLLKDMITAASVSLSPSVAWATFAASWNTRRAERRIALRARFFEVKEELDHISHWAQTQYTGESADSNWRNPLWSVHNFPTEKIEQFNRTIDPSAAGKALSEAMIKLEASIARFRALLVEHQRFVWQGGGQALLTPAYGLAPETNDPTFTFRVSTAWLDRMYQLNKAIHVKGIATASDPEGLHANWKRADAETASAISRTGRASQPWFMWLGHVLAGVLGVVGLGFLVGFFIVFFKSASWPR